MVKLAENQQGGLLRGDRLIAPRTIPDHFGFLFGRLSFEQICLTYRLCCAPADGSPHVVCGNVSFPVQLTQAQFPVRCLEGLQCDRVAIRARLRAQRQMMSRTQVLGERRFPFFRQAFQFRTTARPKECQPCILGRKISGHIVA